MSRVGFGRKAIDDPGDGAVGAGRSSRSGEGHGLFGKVEKAEGGGREVGLGSKERDDRSKLRRVITRVLRARRIVAWVPQHGIKRLLGRTEGDVGVAPKRIDANRIPTGRVRSRPHSVNQVRDHGTLGDQLRGFLRHERPLFSWPEVLFSPVELWLIHAVSPHIVSLVIQLPRTFQRRFMICETG